MTEQKPLIDYPDYKDQLIDTLGELAVAQERIVRVEAVLERWRMRSLELRKEPRSNFEVGIANSYDDLRHDIREALALCDHRGDCTHIEATP